jgi:hypothetical protein
VNPTYEQLSAFTSEVMEATQNKLMTDKEFRSFVVRQLVKLGMQTSEVTGQNGVSPDQITFL